MIVQPTLVILPAIEARLLGGELIRNGSVVRDAATGQIFKLLDEIPKPVGQERGHFETGGAVPTGGLA